MSRSRGSGEPVDASTSNKPCRRRTPAGSGNGAGRRRCGRILLVSTLLFATGGQLAAGVVEKAPAIRQLAAESLLTPESAAGIARRETGGRVLSVTPIGGADGGFRVRLLLDGGRVTSVLVGARGNIRRQR